MFFNTWASLGRVFLMSILLYPLLILMLRVSGKRTLSKMNSFDFVITVAMGSSLSSAILSRDVPFVDAVATFASLIGLQLVITFLSVRYHKINDLVKSEPSLLFHRGNYLLDAMKRERVTQDEVLSAIRSQGISDPQTVENVILESNGEMSVMKRPERSQIKEQTLGAA